ncbi:MAG: tRNA (5-methylaminomethyl-2-thiouridine)(34)-methyltransferase MnmD [Bacteroidales bacterium]|nr:tRNA (5-methylaminomethyl-2-thiouridine)(34)-methyltransferase MnmD [Bacteroidales bacterium]
MAVKLIKTEDGSHSLFVPELDEHYHSTNGAIQESMHVFINAGLQCVLKHKSVVRIFEVGFGTGLNAILSLQHSQQQMLPMNYTSIEAFPLPDTIYNELNYCEQIDGKLQTQFLSMHQIAWGKDTTINELFHLKKINGSFLDYQLSDEFDLIYFDAFGPDKQAELWTQEVFDKCFAMLSANGVLVTYSAKGAVRRSLKAAGFEVERIPGPPGKREMLRAIKKT